MILKLISFMLLYLAVGVGFVVGETCPSVAADTATHIKQYLEQRLTTGGVATVTINSMTLVSNTCYHKLVIEIAGNSHPLTMYLSPDQRFLTSTLYDLASDPNADVSGIAAEVEKLLASEPSPQLKGRHPDIVLVEFGDFQCPYCRRFADWYSSMPADIRDHTTLVYKHLPLSMHNWAKDAAILAACTAEQSSSGFWTLSAYLFQHQSEIKPDNLRDHILQGLSTSRDLDIAKVMSCSKQNFSATLVARDEVAAARLAVRSTPTLFVDGRRVLPLHSQQELEHLLRNEIKTHSTSQYARTD